MHCASQQQPTIKIADEILGESMAADNTSICKSRAGRCNIGYMQASAVVRADIYKFGF